MAPSGPSVLQTEDLTYPSYIGLFVNSLCLLFIFVVLCFCFCSHSSVFNQTWPIRLCMCLAALVLCVCYAKPSAYLYVDFTVQPSFVSTIRTFVPHIAYPITFSCIILIITLPSTYMSTRTQPIVNWSKTSHCSVLFAAFINALVVFVLLAILEVVAYFLFEEGKYWGDYNYSFNIIKESISFLLVVIVVISYSLPFLPNCYIRYSLLSARHSKAYSKVAKNASIKRSLKVQSILTILATAFCSISVLVRSIYLTTVDNETVYYYLDQASLFSLVGFDIFGVITTYSYILHPVVNIIRYPLKANHSPHSSQYLLNMIEMTEMEEGRSADILHHLQEQNQNRRKRLQDQCEVVQNYQYSIEAELLNEYLRTVCHPAKYKIDEAYDPLNEKLKAKQRLLHSQQIVDEDETTTPLFTSHSASSTFNSLRPPALSTKPSSLRPPPNKKKQKKKRGI